MKLARDLFMAGLCRCAAAFEDEALRLVVAEAV